MVFFVLDSKGYLQFVYLLLICCCFRSAVLNYLGMLVHEATHLYFSKKENPYFGELMFSFLGNVLPWLQREFQFS